jgi:hypothetical protein
MSCQWVNTTHLHAFMFESFDNFCGIRRFVNFPNFNSPATESDSIRRDPLETHDRFPNFDCAEMKWPLVDRAGIEEGNFLKYS